MGETVLKSGPMIKRSQNKKKWSLVNYKNRWFELSRSFIIYYDNCEGGREVRLVLLFFIILWLHRMIEAGTRFFSLLFALPHNFLRYENFNFSILFRGFPSSPRALFFVYFSHSLLTPIPCLNVFFVVAFSFSLPESVNFLVAGYFSFPSLEKTFFTCAEGCWWIQGCRNPIFILYANENFPYNSPLLISVPGSALT